MIKYNVVKYTALAAIILSLSGCVGQQKSPTLAEKPARILLKQADTLAVRGYIKRALDTYAQVERQNPQSKDATIALSKGAILAYKNLLYTRTIMFTDDFISYYPGNPLASYMSYLRALSYYEQINDIERDQSNTQKALEALNQVILNYPKTQYAIDAKYKINLTRDQLAGKDMSVGRFYQKHHDYVAAIKRFKRVVKLYSDTAQLPEALARLVETYLALGLKQQAIETAAILGYNHRGNIWYAYAYKLLKKYKISPTVDKRHK